MNASRRVSAAFVAACLFAMILAVGCASTKVSDREQLVSGKIPRPSNILVYDFVATPDDVPADSVLAGESDLDDTPQTEDEIAAGKKVGAEIAAELVTQIRGMGMPAERASQGGDPQINDIMIRGHLLSIKEGSAGKRVAIGFGSGASELNVMVEGFQMTANGPRKLGSASTDAEGAKTPGSALGVIGFLATKNPVGLIVGTGMKVYGEESGKSKIEGRAKQTATEIADVLKKRFKEEGWID